MLSSEPRQYHNTYHMKWLWTLRRRSQILGEGAPLICFECFRCQGDPTGRLLQTWCAHSSSLSFIRLDDDEQSVHLIASRLKQTVFWGFGRKFIPDPEDPSDSTLTHSSLFKCNSRFLPEIRVLALSKSTGKKDIVYEVVNINEHTSDTSFSTSKQVNSSFVHPSSTIGWSLSWPSTARRRPRNSKKYMSTKTSDDCTNYASRSLPQTLTKMLPQ